MWGQVSGCLLNIRYHARCVRVGLAPQAFGTQGFGVFSQTLGNTAILSPQTGPVYDNRRCDFTLSRCPNLPMSSRHRESPP
jgi:hypothetical protein